MDSEQYEGTDTKEATRETFMSRARTIAEKYRNSWKENPKLAFIHAIPAAIGLVVLLVISPWITVSVTGILSFIIYKNLPENARNHVDNARHHAEHAVRTVTNGIRSHKVGKMFHTFSQRLGHTFIGKKIYEGSLHSIGALLGFGGVLKDFLKKFSRKNQEKPESEATAN